MNHPWQFPPASSNSLSSQPSEITPIWGNFPDRETINPWDSAKNESVNPVPASASPEATMHFYQPISKIAHHGQGEVWKAIRVGSNGEFAQKFLHQSDQEESLKRFYREIRAQSGLIHPGIMPIYAVNFEVSPPWYVMPLAEYSLRDYLTDKKILEENEAVALALEISAALQYAHEQGIIHRDIKPENILYLNDHWVVSDFGLCRDHNAMSTTLTQLGTALGTIQYMAPEHWKDVHNVGAPADVYAVGKILYECLTGEMAWPSANTDLIPDRFKYVINKCLEDNPAKRYSSLIAFSRDLEALSSFEEDLALPIEHAKTLAGEVSEHKPGSAAKLLKFILKNLSDEVFLRNFLPSVTPPVLQALRNESAGNFRQIIYAFDQVSSGPQPFVWTDSAALCLERVFEISPEHEIRELVLQRLLTLGTEHNRWAVRSTYLRIISTLTSPQDILIVVNQLKEYPEGADFVSPAADNYSLPRLIQDTLQA
ncbi:serine/threonine protein kinase [Corynebacterium sp. YIM 101645]|uniref:non-specific serine/threonine protein kinase n=1 Tax=Corynebacterium lemuris TaxID=1859292 RepID=A0ABT2G0C4_9CORY|nr:serine/threonine-protein kinase [Corynebacterium lemuris]MCS5480955.1 serine/threonine protein kinase [Corynebacterium lemuris]